MEDDKDLSERLRVFLEAEGFTTDCCLNGAVGLEMLKQYQYELIIVDWNLPELTGPEIVKSFRQSGGITPVLFLTGEGDISNKEIGFECGADDYLTKPFNARELLIRLRALMRRTPEYKRNILELGSLKLDLEKKEVEMAGQILTLQRLEYRLLEFFLRNTGRTFNAADLLEKVWPSDSDASIETVRGYIKTLRKKLAAAGESPTIRNIYGLGYKIDLTEED